MILSLTTQDNTPIAFVIIVFRRTGSSVGLELGPVDAGSFRTTHAGLIAGPLHDRFPGLDGQPGCLLEIMTGRGQRTLEEALRQHARARFAGTVDRRRAVRLRGVKRPGAA